MALKKLLFTLNKLCGYEAYSSHTLIDKNKQIKDLCNKLEEFKAICREQSDIIYSYEKQVTTITRLNLGLLLFAAIECAAIVAILLKVGA